MSYHRYVYFAFNYIPAYLKLLNIKDIMMITFIESVLNVKCQIVNNAIIVLVNVFNVERIYHSRTYT